MQGLAINGDSILGKDYIVDSVPTEGSTNLITSGGVYSSTKTSYTTAGQKSGTILGEKATAEGNNTTSSGSASHAEGSETTASGNFSHSEGNNTTASGTNAHAEGSNTVANHQSQHVFGEYNVLDPSSASSDSRGNFVEIVGNGSSDSSRSNARTLDWEGNEVLAGKLTVGAQPVNNMDVATKQYVDEHTGIDYNEFVENLNKTRDLANISTGIIPADSGLSTYNWKLVYGDGTWVGLPTSSSSRVIWSKDDGVTWNESTLPAEARWTDITYGNGVFLACNRNYQDIKEAWSLDGNTWFPCVGTGSDLVTGSAVACGEGRFFVVGTNGGVIYTDDLEGTWLFSGVVFSTTADRTLKYGNGVLVSTTADGSLSEFSQDLGKTWDTVNIGITGTSRPSLAFGNGVFVATVTGSAQSAWSSDGQTWHQVNLPATDNNAWSSVIYGVGQFLAINDRNKVLATSYDGKSWTELSIDATGTWVAGAANSEKFLLRQSDSADIIFLSSTLYDTIKDFTISSIKDTTDDLDFVTKPELDTSLADLTYRPKEVSFPVTSPGANLKGAVYGQNEGIWVIGGSDCAAISYDGISWKSITIPGSQHWNDILYSSDTSVYLAIGYTACAYAKEFDVADEWTAVNPESNVTGGWSCGAVMGDTFYVFSGRTAASDVVAIGQGASWGTQTLPVSAKWVSAASSGSAVIALSSQSDVGVMIGWLGMYNELQLPISQDWTSITYGNEKYVAVANNSKIAVVYHYYDGDWTWDQVALPMRANWRSVTFGNGRFIAVANGTNFAAVSKDGFTWSLIDFGFSAYWSNIASNGVDFVALATNSDKGVFYSSYESSSLFHTLDGLLLDNILNVEKYVQDYTTSVGSRVGTGETSFTIPTKTTAKALIYYCDSMTTATGGFFLNYLGTGLTLVLYPTSSSGGTKYTTVPNTVNYHNDEIVVDCSGSELNVARFNTIQMDYNYIILY